MKFKVKHKQSLYDFALEHTGTDSTVFLIAAANPGIIKGITYNLDEGLELEVPEEALTASLAIDRLKIKKRIDARSIVPATGKQYPYNYPFEYCLFKTKSQDPNFTFTYNAAEPGKAFQVKMGSHNLGIKPIDSTTPVLDLSANTGEASVFTDDGFSSLQYIYLQSLAITELYPRNLTELRYLYCNSNILSVLDVSNLTALTRLYCYTNQISVLDVSNLTALLKLYCDSNQISVLDVSNLTALTHLYCYINQISVLDVSNLTALTYLYCYTNQISVLDVSNLTALRYLYCNKNQISILDVSNLTALLKLYCYINQISVLDVSNLTALTHLYCYINQISVLDVSNLTALTRLYCYMNQISVLDVSNLTSLTYVHCSSNQISVLDVCNLTSLTYLYCYLNQISVLDVSNLTSLAYLYCYSNQLTTSEIDNILIDLDTNGKTYGILDYSSNPEDPSTASYTAYYNLLAKFWNITGAVPSGDITPPSIPVLVSVDQNDPHTGYVTATWNASTDEGGGSGLAGYKIYASTDGTNYTYLDSTANLDFTTAAEYADGTTVYIKVSAYDNDGNESNLSTAMSITIEII